jgi:phage tail-like protein
VPVPRPFAIIYTKDQWSRVSHQGTALDGDVVHLARAAAEASAEEPYDESQPLPTPAGLAFDCYCRLYHGVPEEGRVERILWDALDPLRAPKEQPPLDLFAVPPLPDLGDFSPATEEASALDDPRGLACDEDDRLFVAEAGARRVLVFDLWGLRLLRAVQFAARPLDLAARGRGVVAVAESPAGLFELDARTGPSALQLPAGVANPTRVAVSPSEEIFLLDGGGTAAARVVPFKDPARAFAVPFATDLEFQTGAAAHVEEQAESFVLVVARRPGEDFKRFRLTAHSTDEMSPLKGRGYDGRGIVCTPDGRIAFWTARGVRHAVAARVRYLSSGRVTTFRLDSGEFQTTWGRVFLDACVPKETEVRLHCVAADEPPEGPALARTPPDNLVNLEIWRPDLSPPMPPLSLVPAEVGQALHRRATGRELPWARFAAGDPFETYEAPALAGPGRYLWVTLELKGNTRFTPRVRALRAEYPSHDYLRRIPRTFTREETTASFLQRYLAIVEGTLGELEARADARRALLDPRGAPEELLPWLAGFLGLVLDERWDTECRRTMVEEAAWLFRFRGTVPGLRRMLEIYTRTKVIIIEKFRVRGMGGAMLGGAGAAIESNSILGGGFRVGGALGEPDVSPLYDADVEDAFETHAHRFSVIVPASLSDEQMDVVRHILDVHRPAHTLFEICTVDAGLRVGVGLHVELTSIIGRGGGFRTLQLGAAQLGRGSIVGRPQAGTSVGNVRAGRDSTVG